MPPRRRRGETVAVREPERVPKASPARARAMEPPRRSTGPARWDDLRWQVSCPSCPGSFLSRSVDESMGNIAMDDHISHHPGHQPELTHL